MQKRGANIAVSIPYVLPLAQPRGVATNMQNIARLQLGKADELSRSCPIQSGVKVQHVKITSCLPLPPVSVCVCANPESETLNPKQPLNIPNPSTIPKSETVRSQKEGSVSGLELVALASKRHIFDPSGTRKDVKSECDEHMHAFTHTHT